MKLHFSCFISMMIAGVLISSTSRAGECAWLPTFGKSIEDIQTMVEQRSGKKPTVSCGGGKEFKVCHSCSDRPSKEQWARIQNMLAEPSYRRWHEGWHLNTVKQALREAIETKKQTSEMGGESFLFTHREIIRSVQTNLAAMGLPCISAWTELPKNADDPIWPVYNFSHVREAKKVCVGNEKVQKAHRLREELIREDDNLKGRFIPLFEAARKIEDMSKRWEEMDRLTRQDQQAKIEIKDRLLKKHGLSESEYDQWKRCPSADEMQSYEQEYQSLRSRTLALMEPSVLRSQPLGIIGHLISSGWHGILHELYGSIAPAICSEQPDLPPCDDMISPRSSHVNIHFYKIHSLIDEYVEQWLKESGYEMASANCAGREKCYQWKSSYVGEVPDFVQGSSCELRYTGKSAYTPENSGSGSSSVR